MKYNEFINVIAQELFNNGVYENNSKILQVLFLKSIVDDANKYKNLDIESLKIFMEFITSFNNDNVTEELLYNTLKMVEKSNNLTDSSLSFAVSAYKFYFERNNQKFINKVLKSLSLPSDYEERKNLILELADYIANARGKYQSMYIGSPTINKIAKTILDIKQGDNVLNTFAGYSTFALFNYEYSSLDGYEIDTEAYMLNNMIKVFCNLEIMNIELGDAYLNVKKEKKYDKVLTDGPIGLKIDFSEEHEYAKLSIRDSDLLNVKITIDSLKENGIGIVTIPNKVLINGAKQFVNFRKELANCGIRSIISLANNCIYNTLIPINILVIEKGYIGDVTLIKLDNETYYDNSKVLKIINNEGIEVLNRIINNGEYIEGVSFNISNQELFKSGEEILVQRYFYKETKKNYRFVKDIDEDIKNILEKLRKNNEFNR